MGKRKSEWKRERASEKETEREREKKMPFLSASKTCEFEYIAPRSTEWKHIKQFLHKPIFNESKISRL